MPNPILSLLGSQGQQATIEQIIGTIKAAKNPMVALNQMIQSDERVKNVMSMIQQSGGDAKKLFYDMAAQKGVDPNSILGMFNR